MKKIAVIVGLIISTGISSTVSAEIYANKHIVGVNYDFHSGDSKYTNPGKYDRTWFSYANVTAASWGDAAAILHLDDYGLTGGGNKVCPTSQGAAYSSVRTIFDGHINLTGERGKGLNLWLQNFLVTNDTITQNESYIGLSYDIEMANFNIRPRAGVAYFNLMNFSPYEKVTGKKSEYSDWNGYNIGLSIDRTFKIAAQPLRVKFDGLYAGGYHQEFIKESFALDDYAYHVELGVTAPLYAGLSVGLKATKRWNYAGYGTDGEFVTVSANYAF